MAKFVKHFSFVMVLIVLISAICMPISAEAATAKGTISAVTNTASGIKVKWTKDSTKAGYYIYRKSGSSGTYKKVKTVKSASTTSWTDTNVTNGTKYVYKVRSYKGSKITANNSTKTIYRMAKPAITVSRASGTSIKVKASNSKATGFQIRYSTKSDFSNYKSVSVAGTSLNKTLKSLAKNTKYYVKVRAYKTVSGKKYYGAFSSVKSVVTTAAQSGTDVAKATISSLTRVSETSVNVQAADAKATGFQIYYGTDSAFASYKTINVAGTNLDKTITNLTKGMKYYVKVRAYKTVNDAKIYGAFSDVKNVVTYYTAYMTNTVTNLYTKPDSSASYKKAIYMDEVTVYENAASSSEGVYKKVQFNGEMLYCWIATGDVKFTTTKETFDHYTKDTNSALQQEIVDYAVSIFNQPTNYMYTKSGEVDEQGRMQFDCSGFVSHVLNTKLQQYVPVFRVSSNVQMLHDKTVLYNQGFASEFDTQVVCVGKPDFNALQPGDIVFFKSKDDASGSGINHCGIYLGDKQFVHSTKVAGHVVIMPLDKGLYYDCFEDALRFIPASFQPINQAVQTSKGVRLYKGLSSGSTSDLDYIIVPQNTDLTLEYYNGAYTGTLKWASVLYEGQRYYVLTPSGSLTPFPAEG